MLKEKLLKEAKNITAPVELDGLFESVELSPEVKENFTTCFEQSVKASAVALAEAHVNEIAEKADKLVESQISEARVEIENKLYEDADKFLNHLAAKWLAENKEQVSRNIKAELFESLMSDLKESFIAHNVVVPEEQVDVVAELDEALREEKAKTAELFDAKLTLENTISGMKREASIQECARGLSDTQKEKVHALIEGLDYNETFDVKLNAIVEMVSKKEVKETVVNESLNNDAQGLNVITEFEEVTNKPAESNPNMARYAAFAAGHIQ